MRTHARVLFVLAVVMTLGACSFFTESEERGAPPPERQTLRVGVGNVLETAPLRLAVADGLFRRGGLRVELVELAPEDDPMAQLTEAEVDVVFADGVELFSAVADGTPLRIQGEAHVAGTDSMALVTLPDSAYTDLGALDAPRIAVPDRRGLGSLTARSVLRAAGVDPQAIDFVVVPFDGMVTALREQRVDAAWLTEPHITRAQKDHGATVLADCAHGATEDFPMSAYAATTDFASRNPRTLDLFRELLARAQQRGTDTGALRRGLPGAGGAGSVGSVDDVTASLVSLGTYPQAANPERLQRVADLMHGSGLLSQRLDVTSLVPEREIS